MSVYNLVPVAPTTLVGDMQNKYGASFIMDPIPFLQREAATNVDARNYLYSVQGIAPNPARQLDTGANGGVYQLSNGQMVSSMTQPEGSTYVGPPGTIVNQIQTAQLAKAPTEYTQPNSPVQVGPIIQNTAPPVSGGTLVPAQSEQLKMFRFQPTSSQSVYYNEPQKFFNVDTGKTEYKTSNTYSVFGMVSSGYDPYKFNTNSGQREILTELAVPESSPTQQFANLGSRSSVSSEKIRSEGSIPFVTSLSEIAAGTMAGEGEVSPYVPGLKGRELQRQGYANLAVESATMLLPEVGLGVAKSIGVRLGFVSRALPEARTLTELFSQKTAAGDIASRGMSTVRIGEKTFKYQVGAVTREVPTPIYYERARIFDSQYNVVQKGTLLSEIGLKGDSKMFTAKGSFLPVEVPKPEVPNVLRAIRTGPGEGLVVSGKVGSVGTGNVILETGKPSYSVIFGKSAGDLKLMNINEAGLTIKTLPDKYSMSVSRSVNVNPKGRMSLSRETTLAFSEEAKSVGGEIKFTKSTGPRTNVLDDFGSMTEALKLESSATNSVSAATKQEIKSMVSSASTQAAQAEYASMKATRAPVLMFYPLPSGVSLPVSGTAKESGIYSAGSQMTLSLQGQGAKSISDSVSDAVSRVSNGISSISSIPSERFDTRQRFGVIPIFDTGQSFKPADTQIQRLQPIHIQDTPQKIPVPPKTTLGPNRTINFFPPGVLLPTSGGTFSIPSFKPGMKGHRAYFPSLIGIVSGKTTSKIPSNIIGESIRLPYAPRRKKK